MSLLFQDDLVVAVLGSGSKGNCTYIGDQRTGVLVDCGLSSLQVMKRMEAVGLGDAPVDAVLITHEHSDHVGAARVLDKRLEKRTGRKVPFFMTAGTRQGLNPKVVPRVIEDIRPGTHFQVGGLRIEPSTVPHDTRDPVGFVVASGATRAGVVTDLGRSTRLVERQLASLDVAVVEFNHDLEMLLDGPYPWQLKQRIRGPHGHLSNAQAAELVVAAAGPRLRHLVLAHLSDENNSPERAWLAADQAMHDLGRTDVTLHVAEQAVPLPPVRVPVEVPAPASRPRRAPVPDAVDAPIPQMDLF